MVWQRGCERSRQGPVQRHVVSHGKELGFYSKVSGLTYLMDLPNGKTLEGFPLGSDMMQFIFSK